MAYRRRESTKKSSGFKIQTEKSVFTNFMDDIPNCLALSTFPDLKEVFLRCNEDSITGDITGGL